MVIDEAAGAETKGEVKARKYKDDKIKSPAKGCGVCKKQNQRSGNEEYCADSLREAMWSWIILNNARLPHMQRQDNMTIKQAERACSWGQGTDAQAERGDQRQDRPLQDEGSG